MKNFIEQIMKRLIKTLIKKYIRPYIIKKIISENVVELKLPKELKVYLVMNMSKLILYKEQIKKQKKIPPPLVKIKEKRNIRQRKY